MRKLVFKNVIVVNTIYSNHCQKRGDKIYTKMFC